MNGKYHFLFLKGQNFETFKDFECWFAKDILRYERAIYHSINLQFDAKVAKKLLNGIYYLCTFLCSSPTRFNIIHAGKVEGPKTWRGAH